MVYSFKSFKPTWHRGVVSLIIIFIFFFLPSIPALNQVQCLRSPCPPIEIMVAPYQLFSPSILLTNWTDIILIFELILSYVLACFLTMKTKDFYP